MKSWAHLMKWYRWRQTFMAGAITIGGCVAVCSMYAMADTIPGLPRLRLNRHGAAERPAPARPQEEQQPLESPVSFLMIDGQADASAERRTPLDEETIPHQERAVPPRRIKGAVAERLPRVKVRLGEVDFKIPVTASQTSFPTAAPEVLDDAPRIQFNRAPRMHQRMQYVEPLQDAAAKPSNSSFSGEFFEFQTSPQLHEPPRLQPKPLAKPTYTQPQFATQYPERTTVQTADHFAQQTRTPNTTVAGQRQLAESPVPTHLVVIPQQTRVERLPENRLYPNPPALGGQGRSEVPRVAQVPAVSHAPFIPQPLARKQTPKISQAAATPESPAIEQVPALARAPVAPQRTPVPPQTQPENFAGQLVPLAPAQAVPSSSPERQASSVAPSPLAQTQVAPQELPPEPQPSATQVEPSPAVNPQVAPPEASLDTTPGPARLPAAETPSAVQLPEAPIDPPAESPEGPANPPVVETPLLGQPPVTPLSPPMVDAPPIEQRPMDTPVASPETSPQLPGDDLIDPAGDAGAPDASEDVLPPAGNETDRYYSSSGPRQMLSPWAPKPMMRSRELTLVEKVLHPSEPCFDRFISPMTNPFNFEDPRTLTEARVIFANHRTPSLAGTPSADVQLFAVQLRAALSERLSIIATKDGYITSNSAFIDDGWADVNVGMKYNLYRDVERQRLLSGGLTFELPVGSTRAQQGNGSGEFHLFLTGMTEIIGGGHWISAAGLRIPTDQKDENEMWYWSNHFDIEIYQDTGVYAFSEFNWYQWTGSGTRFALPIEGGDLFNFGAPGIAGNSIVTGAFGLKYKPNRNLETGVAWELPLTDRRGVLDNRLTLDCIFRY